MVEVNDLAAHEPLAKLLARAVYGRYGLPVRMDGKMVLVGDLRVNMLAEPGVKAIPWANLGLDVVVECTGHLTARDRSATHLDAGAPRVVVSAPSKGADETFVKE